MKGKNAGMIAAILLFGGMGVFYSCVFQMPKEVEILEKTEEPALYSEPAGAIEPVGSGETAGAEAESAIESAAGQSGETVYVHVCGQVRTPGVYELEPGSRVGDAVEAAGGFTEEAREASVNLARQVVDGEQLYVFSKEEQPEDSQTAAIQEETRININLASKEKLMELPGIGEAKADAIIAYRNRQQGFQSIEDLKNIEGIKDGVFNKIKDKITI